MNKKITAFIKNGLIITFLIILGFFISSKTQYDVSATGGSECSQSGECYLYENPGNSGSYTYNTVISSAVIKAGDNLFTFNPGDSNDGCYQVNINNDQIQWNKLQDSSTCQDISHIQIWGQTITDEPEDPDTPTPPTFPSCSEQAANGDWAHYGNGLHQIVGNGLLEGSDDVYSLAEGNYLQCFCSVDKSNGVETLWWRVGELAEEVRNILKGLGWEFYLNGEQWNLGDYWYVARNGDFDCSEPTPTPTTTPSPTPTPTPTDDDEPESRCSSISASPTEGTAPLTVRFNGSGFDEDGEIKRYRFDFGDNSGGQPQIWEQEGSEAYHRYEFAGTYYAALHVQDSRGNWRNGNDACKIKIVVNATPEVLGTSTTAVLPKTGLPMAIALVLISLSSAGVFIYRKYRLV